MTSKLTRTYVLGAGIGAIIALGCGASRPTPELVTARNAYAQARNGEAAQLNPKGVHDAYKALQAAEAAHADDAGSSTEKHFAYIAARRSELAISQASENLARREQARADETYETSLQQQSEQASEQSSQFAQQLTQTQQELQENTQTLQQEQRRLEEARQQAERARGELRQMEALREEQGRLIISLSGVLFETGQAELNPLARQRLDTVARALSAYPDRVIMVEGHTDGQGSDETNRLLSQRRADAVREYLQGRGVAPEQIRSVGKGESEPIASNDTAAGRAHNRRVEIVVEGVGTEIDPRERQNTSGRDDEQSSDPSTSPPRSRAPGAGSPAPDEAGKQENPMSPAPPPQSPAAPPAQPER
jgi:outer membrane protein OmpA-like peptidoglycan-associated protein